jgi:hypothetical protein
MLQPAIKHRISVLKKNGIRIEDLKSSIYLKIEALPETMNITDSEKRNGLKLSAVDFYGETHQGIWLRTRCDEKDRRFSLEECRGTACSATAPSEAAKGEKHLRIFNGEFGKYTLSRIDFSKQPLSGAPLDSQLCRQSWPAWAVSARRNNKNEDLAFPRFLLILQDSNRIHFANALSGKIWNSLPWEESRGIFNQAVFSTDGNLLLKNNHSEALYLSFSGGNYVSLSGGVAASSPFGLNALFSSAQFKTASEQKFDLQDLHPNRFLVHMGGIWSDTGFVTWSDLTKSFKLQKTPAIRLFPDSAQMLSTIWSEESGLPKSFVLLLNGKRLELQASQDDGLSFTRIKSFVGGESVLASDRFALHDEFLTKVTPSGDFQVIPSGQLWPKLNDFPDATIQQSGFDLLLFKKNQKTNTCWISLFGPRSSRNGWEQVHVLNDAPCTTGLGRSVSGAGLVEITPDFLNIYVMDSPSP